MLQPHLGNTWGPTSLWPLDTQQVKKGVHDPLVSRSLHGQVYIITFACMCASVCVYTCVYAITCMSRTIAGPFVSVQPARLYFCTAF